MRPTGAQFLARAGLDTYTNQLLGRWGSCAVEKYVREAVIGEAASRARASQLANTLDRIAGDAAAALPHERFERHMVQGWVNDTIRESRTLTDEIAEALVERVATKVQSVLLRRSAQVPDRPPSPSTSSSDEDEPPARPPLGELNGEVSNNKRKKRHKILRGPPTIEVTTWLTHCGWKFGRSNEVRLPKQGDVLCDRCFKHIVG